MNNPARPPTRMTAARWALVALLALPGLATADPPTPKDAPAGPRVSLGMNHSCAIDKDGGLWCWGVNECQQLGDGDGSTTPAFEPRRIRDQKDWIAIQAGDRFTCGLRAPGSLWCWGKDIGARECYEIADGSKSKVIGRVAGRPIRVGEKSDWKSISAHHRHACGLKVDGSLWCWGDNKGGQLGDGSKQNRTSPVRVGERSDWTQVSAGRDYTCGLTASGEAWCWGRNELGVLGNGTAKDRTQPTLVAGGRHYIAISAGDYSTHAIDKDGVVWQWGSSTNWSNGRRWMSPIKVGRDAPIASLVPGFGCGLTQAGVLDCWQGFKPFKTASSGLVFKEVSVDAGLRACGLKADGSLWCWGDDSSLHLGIQRHPLPPTRVGLDSYLTVTIDDGLQTCAVRVDGTLWCWGAMAHYTPVRQDGASDWARFRRSGSHACKLDTSGTLRCSIDPAAWTVETPKEKVQLVEIGRPGEWKDVQMWDQHDEIETCAIKKDTTAWCWTVIEGTRPRRGFRAFYPEPNQLPGKGWSQIAMGRGYVCGLKADGTVHCWDQKGPGCKGNDASAPVRLPGKWSRLAESRYSLEAMNKQGAVFDWSCRTEEWSSARAEAGWARIATGDGFVGVKQDGSLWATPRPIRCLNSPYLTAEPLERLGEDTDWTAVALGAFHACALKKDGALWCWGDIELGGMGIGRPEHQRKPVRIPLGAE